MEIPYGFDCFAFEPERIKYFESNLYKYKQHSATMSPTFNNETSGGRYATLNSESINNNKDSIDNFDYVRFTRKNEDYTKEQLLALARVGRLNVTEMDQRIFCGIKIQIGIGVVTNFLRKGLQYKTPVKGHAKLINGSWTGIVKGLTVDKSSPIAYDLAFGNFLAWDEEFPYMKFGPFVAIESKLVMLTGSSRRIELSSFGTNINGNIWLTILSLMLILSLLASLWIDWQHTKHRNIEDAIKQLTEKYCPLEETKNSNLKGKGHHEHKDVGHTPGSNKRSFLRMLQDFFFIYFTMLLNKPSVEFDELIWPKQVEGDKLEKVGHKDNNNNKTTQRARFDKLIERSETLKKNYHRMLRQKRNRKHLPTSIRVVSYLWSAVCLIMASIYSGEMLAVMLLHADQNIDTISQLINSRPPIEPVIRQDDFTHTLMLNSLDENMLKLYNKTRVIPRAQVYSRKFIESVSQRKQALLGDDELIETIYDIYHKYYPLYKSRMTYLQYPISIMYRKDFNSTLERHLRRGMVQMFEMGLIHRWYQAQKDTYIKFYDTYERKAFESKENKDRSSLVNNSEQKYKPLSMHHFRSFYKAFFYCGLVAFAVLAIEIITHYNRTTTKTWKIRSNRVMAINASQM